MSHCCSGRLFVRKGRASCSQPPVFFLFVAPPRVPIRREPVLQQPAAAALLALQSVVQVVSHALRLRTAIRRCAPFFRFSLPLLLRRARQRQARPGGGPAHRSGGGAVAVASGSPSSGIWESAAEPSARVRQDSKTGPRGAGSSKGPKAKLFREAPCHGVEAPRPCDGVQFQTFLCMYIQLRCRAIPPPRSGGRPGGGVRRGGVIH